MVLSVGLRTMEVKRMINQETTKKLIEMRLTAMAEAFRTQLSNKDFYSLSFEERFGMMVDIEWSRRKSNHLGKLIKYANFQQPQASIEDIEYIADRELDKSLILRLSEGTYIQEKNNVVILGSTGSGKTYIACALGVSACRKLYSVKYIRLPDLINELAFARGQGIYPKVIKQYKKLALLIIDEWLLTELNASEARDLLDIIDGRHQTGSTIFCSQFAPVGWHDKIGEGTLSEAILDRIVHNSYMIMIESKESMRKRKGIKD